MSGEVTLRFNPVSMYQIKPKNLQGSEDMRFLHLADLHLGWEPSFLGEKASQRGRERDGLLVRAVDFALDDRNNIHAVLIAGDLFETHRPSRAVLEPAIRQLQRLVRGGLFLLTVPGNHDEITYGDSVYRLEAGRWPGVLVQRPMPGEVARMEHAGRVYAFYSMAYHAGLTRTSPPLADFPRTQADRHIGVLHGTLGGEGGDRSLPISREAVAVSGYDCLALGHLHAHTARFWGGTLAVYAGASEAKNFFDPGTGLFVVVNLAGSPTVSTYTAGCRPCLTQEVDLSLCQDEAEVVATIQSLANQQAMFKVVLKGPTGFRVDVEKIQAQCAPLFYHLQINSDSVYIEFELLSRLAEEPTIHGYFIKNLLARLEETTDDEQREIVRRALLRGADSLAGGGH